MDHDAVGRREASVHSAADSAARVVCHAWVGTAIIAAMHKPSFAAVVFPAVLLGACTARPPVAEQRPFVVKSPHGDRVDEYYWLRDDDPKAKRPEVIQYLEAENAYTDAKSYTDADAYTPQACHCIRACLAYTCARVVSRWRTDTKLAYCDGNRTQTKGVWRGR
jgi:hypothetical protein